MHVHDQVYCDQFKKVTDGLHQKGKAHPCMRAYTCTFGNKYLSNTMNIVHMKLLTYTNVHVYSSTFIVVHIFNTSQGNMLYIIYPEFGKFSVLKYFRTLGRVRKLNARKYSYN